MCFGDQEQLLAVIDDFKQRITSGSRPNYSRYFFYYGSSEN
jgi:hypothetical protein